MSNKVSFVGFPRGTTVTIGDVTVAAWGGSADPGKAGTVWDTPASPGTSVTISLRRSEYRVAPEGMQFSLGLTGFDVNSGANGAGYEPAFHDKQVFWDFGEEYDFTSPTNVIALDRADGGNRQNGRYMQGPLGGHLYRRPGTYTVRVAVLEPSSGKWGQATETVTIGNPDSLYNGAATLFVDTTGGYANAPSGAQRFTSLSAALSRLGTRSTAHRVVLENGQTHTMYRADRLFYSPNGAGSLSLRVEARDPNRTKPIVRISGTGGWQAQDVLFMDESIADAAGNATSGTVFSGIRFEGPWDETKETGVHVAVYSVGGPGQRPHSITFDRCEADGCRNLATGTAWNGSSNSGSNTNCLMTVADCNVTNWGHFALYDAAQCSHNIIGNGLARSPDALGGGPRDNSEHNRAGAIRFERPGPDVICYNDAFANVGWYTRGSIHAQQAAVRWGTSVGTAGRKLNMQGNVMESAWTPLLLVPQNSSTGRQLSNIVCDGNMLIGGFQSRAVVECAHGGSTFRNNMMIFAKVNHSESFGGLSNPPLNSGSFIYLAGGRAGNAENERTPISAYNNTMVNLTQYRASNGVFNNSLGFPAINRNNLIHEPNLSSPNTPHAPLVAKTVFAARYKGYIDNTTPRQSQTAHPADTAQIWVPVNRSNALGAALQEPNASVDFQGNLRPEPPSIGACEAD